MRKLSLLLAILFPIQSLTYANSNTADFVFNSNASVKALTESSLKLGRAPAIERHRVWINMSNTQGLFKQILIGYMEGATNGWDNNYDGFTLDANKYLDFYSIDENRKLVVQARAVPFESSDVVPLGYRSGITGDFTISIDHADGDLDTQPVYLEDTKTGTIHNLKTGSYTFATNIGVFMDRFIIRYNKNGSLGTDDFKNIKNNLIVASKDKVITLVSYEEAIKEVSVFDITGKLLYNNSKIGISELEITSIQAGSQILIVKIILESNNVITRKVLF